MIESNQFEVIKGLSASEQETAIYLSFKALVDSKTTCEADNLLLKYLGNPNKKKIEKLNSKTYEVGMRENREIMKKFEDYSSI